MLSNLSLSLSFLLSSSYSFFPHFISFHFILFLLNRKKILNFFFPFVYSTKCRDGDCGASDLAARNGRRRRPRCIIHRKKREKERRNNTNVCHQGKRSVPSFFFSLVAFPFRRPVVVLRCRTKCCAFSKRKLGGK